MKLQIIAALCASASAFAPTAFTSGRGFALKASAAEEAIAAAKAASEKFGADSPEAAVAWEQVEEIDAAMS